MICSSLDFSQFGKISRKMKGGIFNNVTLVGEGE